MSRHRMDTANRAQLHAEEFGTVGEFIASLGQGQDPVAVMLTCWELGDLPDQMSHVQPGEVMIVQNPAGIVPRWGQSDPGAATASICYSLTLPTIRHLIVCGHRDCRMVPLMVGKRRTERLAGYRRIVADVRDELAGLDQTLTEQQRSRIAVEEVVLQQLRHLKTIPDVRQQLDAGKLQLHGWCYDDATAVVRTYCPHSDRFSFIEESD